MFGFLTITVLLPIRLSLRNRLDSQRLPYLAHIIIVGFYTVYVFTNTLFCGTEGEEISINNIQNDSLKIFAGALYAISIILSYPLVLFPIS
jgi:hypothetical protein